MNPFAAARSEFPTASRRTYVDIAARAPVSDRVRAAIEAYLDDRQSGLDTKHTWFEKVEKVRNKVASLMGAEPDQIAFTKNTSHGIGTMIASINWEPGDNIVIAPDFEHPNNVYAWLPLRLKGVQVKSLPLHGPTVEVEQVEQAIDGRTRAVGIASVSFATGGRTNLSRLAQLCSDRGVFLMVDGVQSLGVLNLDVGKTALDALSAATSKSLLGLYGMGVLYCRNADHIHPHSLSRFGVDLGDEKEYVQGDLDYVLAAGARRFELGNYNYLAIHALDASLDHILEIGVSRIEEHVISLATKLATGVRDLGYELISPLDRSLASHVVVFCPPASGPAVSEISSALKQARVSHTVRRFGLRLSFHLYNDVSDVDRVLEVLPRIG